jgi:hypothetical protein
MDKKEDLEKKFLNIKNLNWIVTTLILIWASPIIISYLTIILIKDIFKYIKSKIGNKL